MTDGSTSNESPPPIELDDTINLESKVLLALSRIQNKKSAKNKAKRSKSVSCNDVVQFLKANYSWLDGDIQSQVKTALLSLVKIGIVCILDNAKYRLMVPHSKIITSTCLTRVSHGPKCCCLFSLKCTLNNTFNLCCLIKNKNSPRKMIKASGKKRAKKKVSFPSCNRNPISGSKKNQKSDPSPKAKESTRNRKKKPKCLYCMEDHATSSKKTCETCNPTGTSDIPTDIFSPRDEVRGTSH